MYRNSINHCMLRVMSVANCLHFLFPNNQRWLIFLSVFTFDYWGNLDAITIQSIFITSDSTAPPSTQLLDIDFAYFLIPWMRISSLLCRVCAKWDVNKLLPKNINPLRINVLILAPRWAGNSWYWFWMFPFCTGESQNHNTRSVQSNMVAFDISSQLQGDWVMIHRKHKHYPLWPSWPSAAWINGTSSCSWAPPDKLTLW